MTIARLHTGKALGKKFDEVAQNGVGRTWGWTKEVGRKESQQKETEADFSGSVSFAD